MNNPKPQQSQDEQPQSDRNQTAGPVEMPYTAPMSSPQTQGRPSPRNRWPVWMRELPYLRFPPAPDKNFQLLDPQMLDQILQFADPDVAQQIRNDIKFLDYEVLRLFRERDFEAKRQQNRYRLFQIAYVLLTSLASIFGVLAIAALVTSVIYVPLFLFLETLIALMATFLASVSGRDAPFPQWISNRRRAERLRQEYFRFLMRMSPYDTMPDVIQRRVLVSSRAADINRGVYPDER
jgi:hypothetical protein